MTNYYEELQLNKDDSIGEIRNQLVKLQRIWTQRQINSPAKASAKLLLINEALEVFKTEDSKRNYDDELSKMNSPAIHESPENSAEAERLEQLNKYYKKTLDFYAEKKYDLAREAIDNALRYYNSNTDEKYYKEYDILTVAAWVYLFCGDYHGSLRFCDEGLSKCPPSNNDTKLEIIGIRAESYRKLFLERAQNSTNYYVDPQTMKYYQEALKSAREAYSLLDKVSDGVIDEVKIEHILCLAELLAFTNEKSIGADSAFSEAQRLARQAIQMGDTSGNAEEIIKMCQEASKDTFHGYQGSSQPVTKIQSSRSGGCYVATAVYGSYDCPEVWVLRRYRDTHLSASIYGRVFISLYYLISPTIVKMFGSKKWFNRIIRRRLDRFVSNLESQGYSNEIYYDKM